MGASSSTNEQSVQNNIIDSAVANCNPVSASNSISLSGINYTQPADCPAGSTGLEINQAASVTATCLLSNLQSQAAQSANSLNASAKAGLGFSVSTNISDTANNISSYVDSQCSGVSSTNMANISDTNVRSCNFVIVQDATAQESCQINETQNVISNIAAASSASSQGGSILGNIFGGGSSVITVIIVIVVVLILISAGVGIFMHMKNKKAEEGTGEEGTDGSSDITGDSEGSEGTDGDVVGGFMDIINDPSTFQTKLKKNKPYIVLVIIIVLFIVAFMIGNSKNKDKPITDNDFQNLRKTIEEAHQIAGFATTNQLSPTKPNHSLPSTPINSVSVQDVYSLSENRYPETYPIGGIENGGESLNDFYRPLLY